MGEMRVAKAGYTSKPLATNTNVEVMYMIIELKGNIKQAMKDKDKVKLSTLRMLLSTIETERGNKGYASVNEFTLDELYGLINRNIKQLHQEIEGLKTANRDYSEQEFAIKVLEGYLPKQLSEEEILEYVDKAVEWVQQNGLSFGSLMKSLSELHGKADMKIVSKLAKERFNK